eukprot:m.225296 g.225296  ORF g.225296 m.225296 type:complete len:161 (+) comp16661_c0_seq1:78-560(+)
MASYQNEKQPLTGVSSTPSAPSAARASDNHDIDREYLSLSVDTPSLDYDDVFPTSIDMVHSNLFVNIYNAVRNFVFRGMALLLGPFLVASFAIVMAVLAFSYSFLVAPFLKVAMYMLMYFGKIYRAVIRVTFDPCHESARVLWGHINVGVDLRQSQVRTI